MSLFSPEPTGPYFSYQALSYPLPEITQAALRRMSCAIHDARANPDRTAVTAAYASLDEFTESARKVIGVEVLRRSFEPTGIVLP